MRQKSLYNFLLIVLIVNSSMSQGCEKISWEEYQSRKSKWGTKTVAALASWCTSCKQTLIQAQKSPQDFVFLVAFDEILAVQNVLKKFKIESPCIAGDEIVRNLKIDGLPWKG